MFVALDIAPSPYISNVCVCARARVFVSTSCVIYYIFLLPILSFFLSKVPIGVSIGLTVRTATLLGEGQVDAAKSVSKWGTLGALVCMVQLTDYGIASHPFV